MRGVNIMKIAQALMLSGATLLLAAAPLSSVTTTTETVYATSSKHAHKHHKTKKHTVKKRHSKHSKKKTKKSKHTKKNKHTKKAKKAKSKKKTYKLALAYQYHHKDSKIKLNAANLWVAKRNLVVNNADALTTTDGYLTPYSKMRPRYIHRNGTTWKKSTAKDYRSLLAYWWPNTKTEVAYLRYMTKHGFASKRLSAKKAATFTTTTDVNTLAAAAQAVRDQMEKNISKTKSTSAVNKVIRRFIRTQSMWNENSEYPINDGLNNGYFRYYNNSSTNLTKGNTAAANSKYRLLNHSLMAQKSGDASKYGLFGEFLLANDIDNSNPVVQAEDLNWAYYLLNFGKLTQKNSKANFDDMRIDAVADVDTDLLQIVRNLLIAQNKVSRTEQNANNHLVINEDWYTNKKYYNQQRNAQLGIDTTFFHAVKNTLQSGTSGNLNAFVASDALVNRSNDHTSNKALPNYSFVRAHDQPTQDIIGHIISEQHPNVADPQRSDFKWKYINQAFDYYYAQEGKATKQGTVPYNIPSAYALLLTNKDTVPRVYYGDLYKENKAYMSAKTQNYRPITTMLKLRRVAVAGGQKQTVNAAGDVMTSVRFGSGIATANSKATKKGRNQGSAVIISNNANLASQTVTVNMGRAHANQTYTAAIAPTTTGLTYNSRTYRTDSTGKLTMTIKGYANNPLVHGYLAYLVPKNLNWKVTTTVAANSKGRTKGTHDKYILHSNAALDSHVLLEGFSNFQPMPTKKSEYANVVLARKHTQKLLRSWGITDFEFAPQYRSATEKSFIDSAVRNGYGLSDRYDLGFGKPTKYGTARQLGQAVVAMHKSGIKTMVDYVPNQIYGLKHQQVVTVTRVNTLGQTLKAANISRQLYLANTKGTTKYQKMYGGKYLKLLKKKYPQMFKVKQVTTGKTLPTNVRLTEWQAKYFNGTGLQKHGMGSVLRDGLTNNYYYVRSQSNHAFGKSFVPMSLVRPNYAPTGSVSE